MNLIPFDSKKLPSAVADMFSVSSDNFSTGQRAGYPVVSIKGKVFHIKRGDEITLVTKPGADDEPAPAIEVVVIAAHAGVAKTYYKDRYTEGSLEKPDCYSNDGVAPAADAQDAQAKKCAVCPHNQWGSRITDDGKKAKTCADVKRLAVAPAGQINDPMLLRVPAASLKTWDQYVDLLKKRGAPPPMVVTRVGFDYSVAHPALTFKPMGIITEEMALEVKECMESETVQNIIGGIEPSDTASDDGDDDAPAAKKPAAKKAATKPSSALAGAVEDAEQTTRKAKVVVEDDDGTDDGEDADEAPAAKKPAAKKPAAKPAAKKAAAAAVVDDDDDLLSGLDDMIAGLGFDDEDDE